MPYLTAPPTTSDMKIWRVKGLGLNDQDSNIINLRRAVCKPPPVCRALRIPKTAQSKVPIYVSARNHGIENCGNSDATVRCREAMLIWSRWLPCKKWKLELKCLASYLRRGADNFRCTTVWDTPIPVRPGVSVQCRRAVLAEVSLSRSQYETGETRARCGGRNMIAPSCTALREKQQSISLANCSLTGLTKNEGLEDRGAGVDLQSLQPASTMRATGGAKKIPNPLRS